MAKPTFYVMCRVSGGVTGTRQTLLKKNGGVFTFTSVKKAQEEADRLNKSMNHQYSVADFSYWVVDEVVAMDFGWNEQRG